MSDNLPAVIDGSISSALAAFSQGSDPFSTAAEEIGVSGTFLQFDGNTGDFTYGAGKANEVEHGTKMALNPLSFARGWICWKDSEPVDEMMVSIISGRTPPSVHELADHGPYNPKNENDGWHQQIGFQCVDAAGQGFIFKSSSKSGVRAFGAFLKDFGAQFKRHLGKVPVVELGAISFEVKDRKNVRKYAPVFKIVDWVDESAAIPEAAPEEGADNPENYAQDTQVQAPAPVKAAPPASPPPAPAPAPAPVAEPQAATTPSTGGRRRTMKF